MQIKIISVGPITKEKNFYLVEVRYELAGQEQKYPKKLNSFHGAYKTLKDAKPGEVYDVTETQKGEYKNWDAAELLEVVEGSSPTPVTANRTSSYDEKDARKQQQIVRQSSVQRAIEFLIANVADGQLDLERVLNVAGEIEVWVTRE